MTQLEEYNHEALERRAYKDEGTLGAQKKNISYPVKFTRNRDL